MILPTQLLLTILVLQTPPPRPPSAAEAQAADHFDRAQAALRLERYEEAARELDQAYRLAPAYPVLYSIGIVASKLGHPIEAVDAFEGYLAQGGALVPPERRELVRSRIREEKARIGSILVRTQPEPVDLQVDGKPAGTTPMARGLRVNPGRVSLQMSREGFVTGTRDVEVAAGAQLIIEIQLQPVASGLDRDVEPPEAEASVAASSPAWLGRHVLVTSAGVGVAVLGGVLAFQGVAQADNARAALSGGTIWERAKADYDSAKVRNYVGLSLAVVGAAVATWGAIGLFGAETPQPTRKTGLQVAPWIAAVPSGGVTVQAGF